MNFTSVEAAKHWMEDLSSEDARDKIVDARTRVLQCQRTLLLETGEVQLRLAKKIAVDQDRRKLLNAALNLIESYLMGLECALLKIDFLRQLLDPTTDTASVQDQVPYQSMLEELMYVQKKHAEKLHEQEPFLNALVTPNVYQDVLAPFAQMCVAGVAKPH